MWKSIWKNVTIIYESEIVIIMVCGSPRVSTPICSFIPEAFFLLIALVLGCISILDAFWIYDDHCGFFGSIIIFPFHFNQFTQNSIKQTDSIFTWFCPYIVVITYNSPIGVIMRNGSPCASLFKQIQHSTEYIVQIILSRMGCLSGSFKCFSAEEMTPNCSGCVA